MLADHARPVHYQLPLPPQSVTDSREAKASQFYIHAPRGRAGRNVDDSTERFVEATRMGAST
jgi:hopanoid C-3 methylase